MAITRAQQVRQMLKKGSEPMEQAGVMNYMPSEMVTVPKIAKSSPDTPTAKLAYITPEEQDILVDLNLYGSLKGKPNRGPGGIPSLEGDFGGPGGFGGFEGGGGSRSDNDKVGGGGDGNQNTGNAREDYITNYVSKQKVKGGGKKKPGTTGKDPSDYDDLDFRDPKNKEIIDRQKRNYEKQFFDKGKVPPLGSRATNFKTKLNQRNLQKRLNYINYLQEQIRNKLNKGLIDYQEEEGQIQGLTDFDTLESYIDKVQSVQDLVDKGFYSKDGRFAKGDIPDFPATDMPGVLSIVQDIFKGPITSDKLKQLNEQFTTLEGLKTSEGLGSTTFKDLMEEYQPNRFKLENPPTGGRDDTPTDPCLGPNPPAYCATRNQPTTPTTPAVDPTRFRFMNRGGMVEDAPMGGIMDLDTTRQMLFIGGIAKGISKGIKGITRAAKKVVKSPLGKAAILGAIGFGIPRTSFTGLLGGKGASFSLGDILKKGLLKDSTGAFSLENLSGGKIAALSGLAGLIASKQTEEDDFDIDKYYEQEGLRNYIASLGPRYRLGTFNAAKGGKAEPVAKKVMPLLDMDGKEMDLRDDGGFVPIGRMEKADDVPARLSKNEFVFTADAVRNAGDGDVDKGAEVMYNMMKNLEAGGEVSEESQGLDGAREMFQTAQRLEGVM
jgi:hypothetical protein